MPKRNENRRNTEMHSTKKGNEVIQDALKYTKKKYREKRQKKNEEQKFIRVL